MRYRLKVYCVVALVALLALVASTGGAAAQQSRVFVTSTTSDGNLGGLSSADTQGSALYEAGVVGHA